LWPAINVTAMGAQRPTARVVAFFALRIGVRNGRRHAGLRESTSFENEVYPAGPRGFLARGMQPLGWPKPQSCLQIRLI